MRTVALALVLLALGVGAALLVQEVPAAVLHKALRVLRTPALSGRHSWREHSGLSSYRWMLLGGIRDSECTSAPCTAMPLPHQDFSLKEMVMVMPQMCPVRGRCAVRLTLWMKACRANQDKTMMRKRARLDDALQDGLPV